MSDRTISDEVGPDWFWFKPFQVVWLQRLPSSAGHGRTYVEFLAPTLERPLLIAELSAGTKDAVIRLPDLAWCLRRFELRLCDSTGTPWKGMTFVDGPDLRCVEVDKSCRTTWSNTSAWDELRTHRSRWSSDRLEVDSVESAATDQQGEILLGSEWLRQDAGVALLTPIRRPAAQGPTSELVLATLNPLVITTLEVQLSPNKHLILHVDAIACSPPNGTIKHTRYLRFQAGLDCTETHVVAWESGKAVIPLPDIARRDTVEINFEGTDSAEYLFLLRFPLTENPSPAEWHTEVRSAGVPHFTYSYIADDERAHDTVGSPQPREAMIPRVMGTHPGVDQLLAEHPLASLLTGPYSESAGIRGLPCQVLLSLLGSLPADPAAFAQLAEPARDGRPLLLTLMERNPQILPLLRSNPALYSLALDASLDLTEMSSSAAIAVGTISSIDDPNDAIDLLKSRGDETVDRFVNELAHSSDLPAELNWEYRIKRDWKLDDSAILTIHPWLDELRQSPLDALRSELYGDGTNQVFLLLEQELDARNRALDASARPEHVEAAIQHRKRLLEYLKQHIEKLLKARPIEHWKPLETVLQSLITEGLSSATLKLFREAREHLVASSPGIDLDPEYIRSVQPSCRLLFDAFGLSCYRKAVIDAKSHGRLARNWCRAAAA